MSNDSMIYYLSKEDIRTSNLVKNYIYTNYDLNYYWSNDFSEDFYIELANFGFISISSPNEDGLILLSEMQFDYSILDFKDLLAVLAIIIAFLPSSKLARGFFPF